MEKTKKGPSGILSGFLGGDRPLLGGLGQGGGSLQGLEGLRKDIETTGKRAGAIFKRQKIIDAKVNAIAQELGITMEEEQITVDYGQGEIDKLTELIKEIEDNGDDVGLLTKISALKNLRTLLSKMSKNVGAAAEGVKRTEKVVDEISKRLIKKE